MSKFCTNCGAELNDGMKFCSGCGTPVPQQEEKKNICSNCGAEIKDGMKFCSSCGTPAGGGTDNNETVGFAEVMGMQSGNTIPDVQANYESSQYNTGAQSGQFSQSQPTQIPVQEQYVGSSGVSPYINQPKKKKTGLFIGIGVAVLVVIIAVAGIFIAKGKNDKSADGAVTLGETKGTVSIDVKNRAPFAENVEEAVEKIEGIIDASAYRKDDEDKKDGKISYYKNDFSMAEETDWTVSFNDGSSITLPITNDLLKEQGWTSVRDEAETIDLDVSDDDFDSVLKGPRYKNKNNESIFMDMPLRDDEGILIKDAEYIQINILPFEENEYDDSLKSNDYIEDKKAPGFKIADGKITNSSTVEDVLKAMPNFNWLNYNQDLNYISINYNVKDSEGNTGTIEFKFINSKNLLSEVSLWNMK